MGDISHRIHGAYDHCDPAKVAAWEETPQPRFDYQAGFLNDIVRTLREQGRDVFLGSMALEVGFGAEMKVPMIRERQPGVRGALRGLAFRLLTPMVNGLRDLGAALYVLGDSYEDIKDKHVQEAVKAADMRNPYNHVPRMPLGMPLE